MEEETMPVICHECVLSVGESKKINPQCYQKRSMGYENCKVFISKRINSYY